MRIAISGINGFVGTLLKEYFLQKGYEVWGIPRWALYDSKATIKYIEEADVVINLAGESILKRWTAENFKKISDSRIVTTKNLVEALNFLNKKNCLFISASATGIYNDIDEHDELSTNYNNNKLGVLVKEWEDTALKEQGIRTVVFRLGVVLDTRGGMLKRLLPSYKIGLGAVIGSGKQIMSFVSSRDLLRAFDFVITKKETSGIFNLVAPIYCDNKTFSGILGETLKRPVLFRIPSFFIRLVMGKSSDLLLKNSMVIPRRLPEAGFDFEWKHIEETLIYCIRAGKN